MDVQAVESRDLTGDLTRWAEVCVGSGAKVDAVAPMGGHAGLSFGFDAIRNGMVDCFVIRLAPVGVRRSGNTDVLRQVPLITELDRAGLPVVPIEWSTDDPSWFGTDVMIQRRLSATSIDMFHGEIVPVDVVEAHRPALANASRALARLHAFDWENPLSQWSDPASIQQIFEGCLRMLAKSPESQWARDGEVLTQALTATEPPRSRSGLVHGDFQSNNVLFDPDGSVVAIVDWELADIGPVELDLGWLAMMADPACWHPDLSSRLRVQAQPEEVFEWYGEPSSPRLWWFYALACLRYGSIATYNVRLHRTGRRIDEFNESVSTTIPVLFARAMAVLKREGFA